MTPFLRALLHLGDVKLQLKVAVVAYVPAYRSFWPCDVAPHCSWMPPSHVFILIKLKILGHYLRIKVKAGIWKVVKLCSRSVKDNITVRCVDGQQKKHYPWWCFSALNLEFVKKV